MGDRKLTPTTAATLRFTFPSTCRRIPPTARPALCRPVLKSSYCLEQRHHTLFAAHYSEAYSLQYPGRKTASGGDVPLGGPMWGDRKSTRLNSSHVKISYAVFCLKKKKEGMTGVSDEKPVRVEVS